MADFCRQCTAEDNGADYADLNDMRGLCPPGEYTAVLCEGCGPIVVDHAGARLSATACAGTAAPVEHDTDPLLLIDDDEDGWF